MAIKLEEYSTNEILVSKYLFENKPSKKNRVQDFIFRMLGQGHFIAIIRFVARYLLQFRKPEQVKILLVRYTTVIMYNFLKLNDKKNVMKIKSNILEEIFDEGITIDKLEQKYSENNSYISLWYCDNGKYKKYIDDITEDIHRIINKNNRQKALYNVLVNFYDYFQINTQFQYYANNKKSFDILIAEANCYNEFIEFSIDISKDDVLANIRKYKLNDDGTPGKLYDEAKKLPQMIRNFSIIIGFIAYDALIRKKDISSISAMNSGVLKCLTLDSEATYGSNKLNGPYIIFLENLNEDYYINLSKINDFEFIFNNEKYMFTKNGIFKS